MEYILVVVYYALRIYQYMILAFVIMSWFPNFHGSALFRFLHSIVEPFLSKFRRIIPPIGGLDFSIILAYLLLYFATNGIASFING